MARPRGISAKARTVALSTRWLPSTATLEKEKLCCALAGAGPVAGTTASPRISASAARWKKPSQSRWMSRACLPIVS